MGTIIQSTTPAGYDVRPIREEAFVPYSKLFDYMGVLTPEKDKIAQDIFDYFEKVIYPTSTHLVLLLPTIPDTYKDTQIAVPTTAAGWLRDMGVIIRTNKNKQAYKQGLETNNLVEGMVACFNKNVSSDYHCYRHPNATEENPLRDLEVVLLPHGAISATIPFNQMLNLTSAVVRY